MATCRICTSSYEPFISFGPMPIANGFLMPDQFANEYFFELAVGFCSTCTMVQLIGQPEREQMFNDHYAFYSSTSKHMAEHFAEFAQEILREYANTPDSVVMEIGSNDGIMLQHFAQAGLKHVGVEPSANVAAVAQSKGINSLVKFFNQELAAELQSQYGSVDAILGANVICHDPDYHSVLAGVKTLLKPRGVFVYEEPYIGDIVQKTSYDQIYDEHVFYFSVKSVQYAAAQHGLEVFKVVPQDVHGGSMRYYLGPVGSRPITDSVREQLAIEEQLGLSQPETYERLRQNIETSRDQLHELLTRLKREGKRVVGYGATSKSTTVTNYCKITPDLVEFISDTTPIKQGKYSPGTHIPVKPYEAFTANYPQYALLFAWNHAREIKAKEMAFKTNKGQWILFVPRVHITT